MHFRRRCCVVSAAVLLSCPIGGKPSAGYAEPRFTDVTVGAGLDYVQHVLRTRPDCIFELGSSCEPERITGGAAVGDVEADGDLDLFVTRLGEPDILFLNSGDGSFADGTEAAGLAPFGLQSNGAAFGDIDNDGDLDLYVTVLGDAGDVQNNRNHLFINNGSGRFSEQAIARGAASMGEQSRRVFSATFGDYDRDGWLDLHATEWLPGDRSHSRMLRNLGEMRPGHFEDVTSAAGLSLRGSHAFASSFSDLDLDGWPDLAVAADFATSRLFWNNRDGTFSEGTDLAGVGTDENGMGSTIADFDGDGDLDWFVTSIFDASETCESVACSWGYTGNRLYRNEGDRVFSDATSVVGVQDGQWGWGAAFFDYNNNGTLDLVMTNGVDFPHSGTDDLFNNDPMRFWENDGTGLMTEMSARVGLTDRRSGKGLLVFDYDDDGDLDVFVVNNGAGPVLYRNDGGNQNSWLRVRTVGSTSNRDGIGARVKVSGEPDGRPQLREIGSVSHFLGQSERVAHFGLGKLSGAVHRVEIWWPSGCWQSFDNVQIDTTLVAREPEGGCSAAGSPTPTVDLVATTTAVTNTQLPTPSPNRTSPTPFTPVQTPSPVCRGDCDGDGVVRANDLTCVLLGCSMVVRDDIVATVGELF